ncbi:MAG: sigma-54 dependent transcriptional regulator [Candidatus Binatia bacterium]
MDSHAPLLDAPHCLLVDPDRDAATLLRTALARTELDVRVTGVHRLRTAMARLSDPRPPGCVVTELVLPDASGASIVRDLGTARAGVPVVVVTGAGSEELAVRVLRLGAADYVPKRAGYPERVAGALRELLGRRAIAAADALPPLAAEAPPPSDGSGLVARSAAMHHVLLLAERASRSAVPVLLEGETGTGKELLARAIHDHGPRRRAPFLVQNCAAIPDTLLESEIFGHVRGAFTGADRPRRGLFAEAEDGTVFLDEIAEAPLSVQAKLLRVVQHGEVKAVGADRAQRVQARIVAASNRRLEDEVRAGRFRNDLFFRLSVFPIRIPPLRQRVTDLAPLLSRFLRRYEIEEGRATGGFAPDALTALARYAWPGNVRELEHEVHRLVLTVAAGARIQARHLPQRIRGANNEIDVEPLARILARVEHAVLRQRLDAQPSKAAAARSLGISREALYAKLRRLRSGVPDDD